MPFTVFARANSVIPFSPLTRRTSTAPRPGKAPAVSPETRLRSRPAVAHPARPAAPRITETPIPVRPRRSSTPDWPPSFSRRAQRKPRNRKPRHLPGLRPISSQATFQDYPRLHFPRTIPGLGGREFGSLAWPGTWYLRSSAVSHSVSEGWYWPASVRTGLWFHVLNCGTC
jgi:hypothetical protein